METRTTTMGPPLTSSACDSHYLYNGSCYAHTYLEYWNDSNKDCIEQFGGDLISIHSQEEQDFLNKYFREKTWIGVECKNNKWEWIDGSEINYQNWFEDEPKNNTCAMNTLQGWIADDRDGFDLHTGICKYKPKGFQDSAVRSCKTSFIVGL